MRKVSEPQVSGNRMGPTHCSLVETVSSNYAWRPGLRSDTASVFGNTALMYNNLYFVRKKSIQPHPVTSANLTITIGDTWMRPVSSMEEDARVETRAFGDR